MTGEELARISPANFTRRLFRNYKIPPHVARIDLALRRLAAGETRRLMISMPPRHGKSLLASKGFPLWFLGHDPSRQVILTGYGQNLPSTHSRFIRGNLAEAAEVFPALAIADGAAAVDHWQTTQGGGVLAAGVGGGITGHGGDLLLVDDPIKDWKTANSRAYKDAAWDWFNSTLETRLSPGGVILLIQTRWAVDDLAGRIIAAEGQDWEIISLPAISDEGTDHEAALWPERYPLERLRKIREKTKGRIWSSLYQQQPIEHSEEALGDPKRGPVVLWRAGATEAELAWMPRPVYGYVDPAAGGEDSTAVVFGGPLPDGRIGILAAGMWRKRSVDMADIIAAMAREVGCELLTVEDNLDRGYTRAVLEERGVNTRAHMATKNKVGRIGQYVKARYAELVFGPRCAPEYLSEVAGWWELAKHDDAADALAGLVETLDAGRHIAALDYEDFPYFG